jgi:anti-anti-sigma factor
VSIQQWSENVLIGEMTDDPQFTDDINAIIDQCAENPQLNVLVDLREVNFLNSSNIAKLLKLRKTVQISNQRKLKLCGVSTQVWGVFLVTGLDRIFDFYDDLPSGLAALQLSA